MKSSLKVPAGLAEAGASGTLPSGSLCHVRLPPLPAGVAGADCHEDACHDEEDMGSEFFELWWCWKHKVFRSKSSNCFEKHESPKSESSKLNELTAGI